MIYIMLMKIVLVSPLYPSLIMVGYIPDPHESPCSMLHAEATYPTKRGGAPVR